MNVKAECIMLQILKMTKPSESGRSEHLCFSNGMVTVFLRLLTVS